MGGYLVLTTDRCFIGHAEVSWWQFMATHLLFSPTSPTFRAAFPMKCSKVAFPCFSRVCMMSFNTPPSPLRTLAKTARSDNTTLQSFKAFDYKKGLGPGLYDIHSPVVPPVATLQEKLEGDPTNSICVQFRVESNLTRKLPSLCLLCRSVRLFVVL